MAGVEALARLNPKNVRFDVGRGGIPDLTPEIIAAACAGLPPIAYRLALVKYAGQMHELSDLKIRTLIRAADLAIRHGWGRPMPGQLQGITTYAIWRVVSYHHCPACHGSGKRLDDRRRSWKCVVCAGTGGMTPTEEIEASVAGFSLEDWRNTWRRRADRLTQLLERMDRKARAHIHWKTSDECA